MKRIGLLACSKSKLGENSPKTLYKAQEIYTGYTFTISKNIGLNRFECEDWHILSAKHNLLDKDDKISYYDMYLGHQNSKYKKEWAATVISKLKEKYDLDNDVFYIFAGKDYYKDLLKHLHCFVFGYKNSNSINMDDITEYYYGKKISKAQRITKND